jgi:predicted RNA-binding Zn ribbon-like protein
VDGKPVLRFADGGWMEACANHPALELLNTVAWRGDRTRTVDRIDDASALVRWAGFAGILDPTRERVLAAQVHDDGAAAEDVVTRTRELRDALYDVVQPLASGGRVEPAARARLLAELLQHLGHLEVTSTMPLRWATGPRSLGQLPDVLGHHAWNLLDHEDATRLRQCRDDACGWLFLDRSKNGSRVWCSSADCGNRNRARRHRSRATSTNPARVGRA